MGITPETWWVNRKTDQKMGVANLRNYTTWSRRVRGESGRIQQAGFGRDLGRHPCHLEGEELYLAWLSEDEIRSCWRPLRLPRVKAPYELPYWLVRREHGDVLLYSTKELRGRPEGDPVWLAIQRIRSNWVMLSAISERTSIQITKANDRTHAPIAYDWGSQLWNTQFLSLEDAVPRMLPRFGTVRKSKYDALAADELNFEDPNNDL